MWQIFEDPDYYVDDLTWQDMEDQDEDMLNEELQAEWSLKDLPSTK